MPLSPISLRSLIAANLRRLRSATNAEPADVVRAAEQFGLEWTASWYSAIEKGQKPISAEQLLALPPVLTAAFAYRVSLSDLILGNGSLHLGKQVEGTTISLHYLRELVTSSPFKRSFLDFEAEEQPVEMSAAQAAAEKMREIVRANLGEVDIRALARAEAGASDLEAKLARKLGVAEIVVIAAAASVFGHSMAEERDALMNPPEPEPVPKAAAVGRKLTTAVTNRITEAAEAAKAKASVVAASTAVTAEFPLVQLDGPRPKPTEVASESLRERYLRSMPSQRPATGPISPAPVSSVPVSATPISPGPAYDTPVAAGPSHNAPISPAAVPGVSASAAPGFDAPVSPAPEPPPLSPKGLKKALKKSAKKDAPETAALPPLRSAAPDSPPAPVSPAPSDPPPWDPDLSWGNDSSRDTAWEPEPDPTWDDDFAPEPTTASRSRDSTM